MARPSNTAQRREEIVTAMMTVMAQQGYAGASMAQVARAAGLRQGLLHYHFASKQEMLLEVGARLTRIVEERYAARVVGARDAAERLEAWLAAHLEVGEDQDLTAVRCWVVLGAEALSQPEVAALYTSLLKTRRTQLRALVVEALGSPARARVDAVVTALLACVEGLFRLGVTAPQLVERGSALQVAKLTLDGLLHGK